MQDLNHYNPNVPGGAQAQQADASAPLSKANLDRLPKTPTGAEAVVAASHFFAAKPNRNLALS